MQTFVQIFGLVPYRIGGMERLIREMAVALAERGWRTIVLFSGEPAPEVRCYLAVPGLQICVLPNFDRSCWAGLSGIAALLREVGAACVQFHFTSPIDPTCLVARMNKTRCFVTVHSSMPESYVPRRAPAWKRIAVKPFVSSVERVFCVSRFVQEYMESTGYFAPDQLVTVYNGVEVPEIDVISRLRARYRSNHSISDDVPLVLQVGQLISDKGVEDLLEAAPLVLARFRDAKFMFVGTGPDEQSFRERARNLGIEHAVRWVGVEVDPCGSGTFAAADVLCIPSRWREAFGLATVEAMAYKVPVVGTRVGGIGEVVSDRETGFLVDRRSPKQLADRILDLLANRELRERMGHAGYQRVNAHFDIRNTVRQMLDGCGISLPLASLAADAR